VFARVTLLEIDTIRIPIDDALELFREAVMPRLKDQPGYCGIYAFTTPEGRTMLVSFWDTAEQADAFAASRWYPEVLEEYTTLFRTPPGREHYEVRFAEPPVVQTVTLTP